LLALADALDGMSRAAAARQMGMDRQPLRDRVIRFNAERVEGLGDRPESGRPIALNAGQPAMLKALVLRGPPAGSKGRPRVAAPRKRRAERDGVSTRRAKDLGRIVEDRSGLSYIEKGMLRLLHDLGQPPAGLPVACSPELNAVERVWLHLRERSQRLWPSSDDILEPAAPPGTPCSTGRPRPPPSARLDRATQVSS
jgi:transposase